MCSFFRFCLALGICRWYTFPTVATEYISEIQLSDGSAGSALCLVFQSEQVRQISESVRTIQNNEEVGERYMQAWEEILMERREAREETLKEVQHLIDEAEQKQNEAEQETDRIKREARKLMDEAHDRELDAFLDLLNRGFSVEEAKAITNSREDIVKEALTRQ